MARGALLVIFAAFVFMLATTKMYDPDVGWHLRLGEHVVRTWSLSNHDIYSWTRRGAPFYDTEWLFSALMYLVYAKLGVAGVTLAKAGVIAAAFVFLVLALQEASGSPLISLMVADVVAVLTRVRFTERPQIFSYLFLALFLWLLTRFRNRKPVPLWLIPLVVVIWANMHAGAALGVVLLALFVAGEAARHRLSGRWRFPKVQTMALAELRWPAIWAGLGFVALFATPNTYHLFDYIIRFTPHSAANVTEHAPLIEAAGSAQVLYVVTVLLLAAAAISKLEVWGVLSATVFGLATFTALRFFADFAFVTAALVAVQARGIWSFSRRCLEAGWGRLLPRRSAALVGAGLVAVIAWQAWQLSISPRNDVYTRLGVGATEKGGYYPAHALRFLDRNDVRGRMFNSLEFGGYIMWREFPRRKVFWDGRIPVYSQLVQEYTGIRDSRKLQRFWKRHGIDFGLVINRADVTSTLLFDKRDWALVYWDDISLIYLRRESRNAELIRRFEYKYARPYLTDAYVMLRSKYVPAALRELSRTDREAPYSSTPHLAKAQILLSHGRTAEGLSEVRVAQKLDPNTRNGDLVLGMYLMGVGAYHQAVAKLRGL